MTPDQLQALAARLLNHAAMHESVVPNDDELRQWRDDLIAAERYLRQCAQAEPVAWLHPANSSCVTTDPDGYERGIPLYTHPQPQQADAVEALRMALDALSCTGEPDDPGHRCGHCDEYVDRNSVVRKLIRAVLAAQGGGNAE